MRILSILITLFCLNLIASEPDWSDNFQFANSNIPKMTDQNRANIFNHQNQELQNYVYKGAKHVLSYPVNITELLLPYNSLLKFFEAKPSDKIRKYVYRIARKITKVEKLENFFDLIGTVPYPKSKKQYGPNFIYPIDKLYQKYPMGTSIIETKYGTGLTFSCAACHSANLFGVKVIGLTNRFPRSNEFFVFGKKAASLTNSTQYQLLFGASKLEKKMMKKSLNATKYIGAKKPVTLGLDTSLRQTALSLARRAPDKYASKNLRYHIWPRRNELEDKVADSKPMVWWNLKYKTRWLSDGSIVSGNPVHTNILWNEIGRGADLVQLSKWFKKNKEIIDELTTYVFNTKAPVYNDFFPNKINLSFAKRGEKLFLKSCSKCHGVYQKGWSNLNLNSYNEKLQTTKVFYHQRTPVIDVGTDPSRYQGMKHFSDDLNRLEISVKNNIKVVPQKGYVPPPLVGIWSRWPYFHNNSAPNLCEVLTPSKKRIDFYIAGPAINKETDFDQECVGYPYPNNIPESWKGKKAYQFDSTIKGLSNQGHSKMLLNKDGSEKFTQSEKLFLIEFLKTL